jgi:hypothetical protein
VKKHGLISFLCASLSVVITIKLIFALLQFSYIVFFITVGSELGYEIDIRGNQIQTHCDITSDSLLLLTENFMKNFAFRTVSLQEPMEQLRILRAHSTTVAFCSVNHNKYLLATKKPHIHTFMQKLVPNKSTNRRTNPRSSTIHTAQREIESEDES